MGYFHSFPMAKLQDKPLEAPAKKCQTVKIIDYQRVCWMMFVQCHVLYYCTSSVTATLSRRIHVVILSD